MVQRAFAFRDCKPLREGPSFPDEMPMPAPFQITALALLLTACAPTQHLLLLDSAAAASTVSPAPRSPAGAVLASDDPLQEDAEAQPPQVPDSHPALHPLHHAAAPDGGTP